LYLDANSSLELQMRHLLENWYNENLSLYSILEYKFKDIFIFSEYFYNYHGILLIIISFVLTISMIVSIIVAKDFVKKY
jgi:hypothetical protein